MDKMEFFNKIIDGWIKKDVERMLSDIPAADGIIGNINFPLALCILSYINALGCFLIGADPNNTEISIRIFIEKCFGVHTNEYNPKILSFLFRHGLSHSYFPRGGISRNNTRPPLYKEQINGEEIPILDTETFARDFLESLDIFKNVLDDNKYILRTDQIKKEIKENCIRHRSIINALPKRSYQNNDIITRDPWHEQKTGGCSGYFNQQEKE